MHTTASNLSKPSSTQASATTSVRRNPFAMTMSDNMVGEAAIALQRAVSIRSTCYWDGLAAQVIYGILEGVNRHHCH